MEDDITGKHYKLKTLLPENAITVKCYIKYQLEQICGGRKAY
jgi:hypothetical protein